MVGILIATFGDATRQGASATSEVLQEFKSELEVLPDEEQVAFVKGLGIPAQFTLDATRTSIDDSTTAVQRTPPTMGVST